LSIFFGTEAFQEHCDFTSFQPELVVLSEQQYAGLRFHVNWGDL